MLLNLREAVDFRTGLVSEAGEISTLRFVNRCDVDSASDTKLNGHTVRRPTSDDLDLESDLYDDLSVTVEDDLSYTREGETDEQAILEERRGSISYC
jgi:hypothetical protein